MTSSIGSGMFSGMDHNITEGIMSYEKVQQNRIRRIAERQGLALQVSRRRDPRSRDYGHVWLRWLDSPNPDQSNDAWIGPFNSLDHVELLLTTDLKELPSSLADVDNIETYLARHDVG